MQNSCLTVLYFRFLETIALLFPSILHGSRGLIYHHSNWCSLVSNEYSISLLHSIFVLIFRSLIMMFLCINFFGFILFEGCSPWTYRFLSFAKLGKFSPTISLKNAFIPLFPLLELHDMDASSFVITPQVPRDCSFSFSLLSLFRLGEFYWAVFRFTDSVLSSSFHFLSLSSDFFFF